MANDANIRAIITAKDEASGVLRGFSNNVSNVNDGITKAAKAVGIGLLAAGGAAVAFGVSSVKAFSESENVMAQTNAVLKSTGSIAGVTAEQTSSLANSLQKVTRFSDETIQSGENLLLTFTNIGKDIFPDATKVMLDMSQALGQDVKSSAIQVGKALQDPILGVTALRRVGVNFNDTQRDIIKNLVETGRSAEAQQMILKELKQEFGGSAEAAGKTFAGSLERLKNQLDDVKESLGKTLVNALTPFVSKAAELISAIDWESVINRSKDALNKLYARLEPFLKLIKDVAIRFLQDFKETLTEVVIPAMISFGKEIQKLYDKNPLLLQIAGAIAAIGLAFTINPVATSIGLIIVALVELYAHFDEIKSFAVDSINKIKESLTPLNSEFERMKSIIVTNVIEPFKLLWETLTTQVQPAFKELIDSLDPLLKPALIALGVLLLSTAETMTTVLAIALRIVITLVNELALVFSLAAKFATLAVDIITGKFSKLPSDIKDVIIGIDKVIAAPFVAGFKLITDGIDQVRNAFEKLPSSARTALNGVKQIFENTTGLGQLMGVVEKLTARATGGPVTGNQPYLVGEKGPELFVPNSSGSVMSADKTKNMGENTQVAQTSVINISVNAGAFMGTDVEARRFAQELMIHMRDIAGSKNMSLQELLG